MFKKNQTATVLPGSFKMNNYGVWSLENDDKIRTKIRCCNCCSQTQR